MTATLEAPPVPPDGLQFKAAPAVAPPLSVEPEGVITAIVSITGVEDDVRDIIEPGAYTDTLARRRPKVCRAHSWTDAVGRVPVIEEWRPGDARLPAHTKDGKPWPKSAGALVASMQYNMASERGRAAFEDVKFYSETDEAEYSIGYKVPPGQATRDRAGVRRIKKLDLYEISDVLFGANGQTMTLDVKSACCGSCADGGECADEDGGEEKAAAELHAAAMADPQWGAFTGPDDDESGVTEPDDSGVTDVDPVAADVDAGVEPEVKAYGGAVHVYFPADDGRACGECDRPAGDDAHSDPAEVKAVFTAAEIWARRDREVKAAGVDTHPGDGNIRKLKAWYLNPARSKIRWGTPGDFAQCVRIAGKHMPPGQTKGFCANVHKEATGTWPGKNAHNGTKTAEGQEPAEPDTEDAAAGPYDNGGALPKGALAVNNTGEPIEVKLLAWEPAAEVGPGAAHLPPPTQVKRGVGPGFDDSLETRREAVRLAVSERLGRDGDRTAAREEVTLLGTWPEKVIATRTAYDDDGAATEQAYSVGYRIADGAVHLDEPEPVNLDMDAPAGADTLVLTSTIGTALDEAVFAGKALADHARLETKAGRVLSGLNVRRLNAAVTELLTVLAAAGVDIVPPTALEKRDARKDNTPTLPGTEPPVVPDTTSDSAREVKARGAKAVITHAELAEGLAFLGGFETKEFEERRHPRDARGHFIQIGGRVKISPIAGGGQGTVRGIGAAGKIDVERDSDHKREQIAKGYLTMLPGGPPTPKDDAARGRLGFTGSGDGVTRR